MCQVGQNNRSNPVVVLRSERKVVSNSAVRARQWPFLKPFRFSAPFALFVIRFRNMRPPAHTHPLSGKPPAKHISSKVLSNTPLFVRWAVLLNCGSNTPLFVGWAVLLNCGSTTPLFCGMGCPINSDVKSDVFVAGVKARRMVQLFIWSSFINLWVEHSTVFGVGCPI